VPAIAETVRYVAAGANAYYELDGVATAGKQPDAAAPPPTTAPDERVTTSGQRWIGGSVLYID
jgi:hypothetical protein